MFIRTDADADSTIYTLERALHYDSGKAAVGVIPKSVRFNRGAGLVHAYHYMVCRDDGQMSQAMVELSRNGVRRMAQAMDLSRRLVGLSQKLQPYRSVLQDFASAGGRTTHFGPYVSLVSGKGEGRTRRNLYNVLNLTEQGRLEGIDWVLSTPRHGRPSPVLYSYKAARMTGRARRGADLVDATLPDPVTGRVKGGVRIRCTREEFAALVRRMKESPELRWAVVSLKKSMTPVGEKERREGKDRLIGARVREMDDMPRRRTV